MRKPSRKEVFGVGCTVLVFFFSLVGFTSFLKQHEENNKFQAWMSGLDDETSLRDVAMPGSHNTMALRSFGSIAGQCQSLSISDQLRLGVRFLDIRLKEDNDKMKCVHAYVDQKASFEAVTNAVKDFLTKNSSEFIIMSIKQEADSVNSTLSFEESLKTYLKDDIYLKSTRSVPSKVKEVRGKVLLLSRYKDSTIGIPANDNWKDSCSFLMEDTDIYVQDTYNITSSEQKKSEIINCFNVTGHKLKINFLSAVQTNYFPPSYAHKPALDINPWINEEISKYHDRGIVLYDFITKSNMEAFFEGIL